jgi:hypothetical protein
MTVGIGDRALQKCTPPDASFCYAIERVGAVFVCVFFSSAGAVGFFSLRGRVRERFQITLFAKLQ